MLGHRGLTATPNKNLVSNVGFGQFATHTKDSKSKIANLPASNLGVINHPETVARDAAADLHTLKVVFQGSFVNRVVVRLSSIPLVGRLVLKIKDKF